MENNELRPVQVNMEEWEQSGEGWNAITYYHKTDNSLLLKLNAETASLEDAVTEYKFTKAVYDLGVKCPATLSLATDGKRYGIITERLVGKKSFTRILSENPEMLDSLAKDMAEATRTLHSIQCDTELFESVPERIRKEINDCEWIKSDIKEILNSYADQLRPVTTCIHGDLHPGNYLRADKGDYWIDLGRFGYGDPVMDIVNMYILAYLTPGSAVKWILHVDQKTFAKFFETFCEYYYGKENYHSAATQQKLKHAVRLAVGHILARNKAGASVYTPFIKGREKVTFTILKLISPLVKK